MYRYEWIENIFSRNHCSARKPPPGLSWQYQRAGVLYGYQYEKGYLWVLILLNDTVFFFFKPWKQWCKLLLDYTRYNRPNTAAHQRRDVSEGGTAIASEHACTAKRIANSLVARGNCVRHCIAEHHGDPPTTLELLSVPGEVSRSYSVCKLQYGKRKVKCTSLPRIFPHES